MAVVFRANTTGAKRNRKEIMFSNAEMHCIQFASKYYAVDNTTAIRILLRSAVIEIIAKAMRDGVPELSTEMLEILGKTGLFTPKS